MTWLEGTEYRLFTSLSMLIFFLYQDPRKHKINTPKANTPGSVAKVIKWSTKISLLLVHYFIQGICFKLSSCEVPDFGLDIQEQIS